MFVYALIRYLLCVKTSKNNNIYNLPKFTIKKYFLENKCRMWCFGSNEIQRNVHSIQATLWRHNVYCLFIAIVFNFCCVLYCNNFLSERMSKPNCNQIKMIRVATTTFKIYYIWTFFVAFWRFIILRLAFFSSSMPENGGVNELEPKGFIAV